MRVKMRVKSEGMRKLTVSMSGEESDILLGLANKRLNVLFDGAGNNFIPYGTSEYKEALALIDICMALEDPDAG